MLRCVYALAAGAVLALETSVAFSAEPLPAARRMHVGREVQGPYAFYDFCRRAPGECQPDDPHAPPMPLDAARWAELNEVNDVVNKTVIPMTDMEQYGVPDYWAIATRYGDCEKYALTKQLYLRQRGWPMADLLITVVVDENGEGHAILTARTSRGDLVLDNRRPTIVGVAETPYTYVKRQSALDPYRWLSLQTTVADSDSEPEATAAITRKK